MCVLWVADLILQPFLCADHLDNNTMQHKRPLIDHKNRSGGGALYAAVNLFCIYDNGMARAYHRKASLLQPHRDHTRACIESFMHNAEMRGSSLCVLHHALGTS
jgi:hypothetical protein